VYLSAFSLLRTASKLSICLRYSLSFWVTKCSPLLQHGLFPLPKKLSNPPPTRAVTPVTRPAIEIPFVPLPAASKVPPDSVFTEFCFSPSSI
jgi:hypothetical protein